MTLKKLSMHEKIALFLLIIAALLIIMSYCPNITARSIGLIQGVASGIISGIVLLFITGIKERDYKHLSSIYETLQKSNMILSSIIITHNKFYNEFYNFRKQNCESSSYLKLITNTYANFRKYSNLLNNLDFGENYETLQSLSAYNIFLQNALNEVANTIRQIKKASNSETFDIDSVILFHLKDVYYDIQETAYYLSREIIERESELSSQKELITKSFI